MITLIKLGGSLITDKTKERTFRKDEMNRLAQELKIILDKTDFPIILGHGSGSFGHFEAKRHNTIHGVHSTDQWQGFTQVAHVARELNFLVLEALLQQNIPAISIQPFSISSASDSKVVEMSLHTLQIALVHHLLPVVYGDVGFDRIRGGTILSTETIFDYLVPHLPVNRILLLGEVDGVWDSNKQLISKITPNDFAELQDAFDGASGVDVTGGMYAKVAGILELVQQHPNLQIQIINGTIPNLLQKVMLDNHPAGTIIQND